MLDESKNSKELQQTAVYLLIGENEQELDRPLEYVGESDDGLTRIWSWTPSTSVCASRDLARCRAALRWGLCCGTPRIK